MSEDGRPPLVLHVYPKVDRWREIELPQYRGTINTASIHESGYERDGKVYDFDWPAWANDLFEKRFTDTELTCEWWAAYHDYHEGRHRIEEDPEKLKVLWDRLVLISRMLEFEHYDM